MIFFLLLALAVAARAQQKQLTPDQIAKQIMDITNEERQRQGLPELVRHEHLQELARIHSANMMKHHFFSHTDHEHRDPGERKDTYAPKLFGGVGENIAYIHGIPRSQIAARFHEIWMNSSGHRANILRSRFSHLGVAVVREGQTYYATQVFGNLVAEMTSEPKESYDFGSEQVFEFKFLGAFPKEEIAIFMHFPDRNARFYTSKNAFYTGVGRYEPVWLDDERFAITVTFDKGRGIYRLTMGSYGSYNPGGLELLIK